MNVHINIQTEIMTNAHNENHSDEQKKHRATTTSLKKVIKKTNIQHNLMVIFYSVQYLMIPLG